jgi:hypothetical protein
MKRLLITVLLLLAGVIASLAQGDEQNSVPAIRSQAEFDAFAVVYDANTSYALPHVLFVIDRSRRTASITSARSSTRSTKTSSAPISPLEPGQVFFKIIPQGESAIHSGPSPARHGAALDVRVLGGDLIPPDQIKLTSDIINKSFYFGCLQTKFLAPGNSVSQPWPSTRVAN